MTSTTTYQQPIPTTSPAHTTTNLHLSQALLKTIITLIHRQADTSNSLPLRQTNLTIDSPPAHSTSPHTSPPPQHQNMARKTTRGGCVTPANRGRNRNVSRFITTPPITPKTTIPNRLPAFTSLKVYDTKYQIIFDRYKAILFNMIHVCTFHIYEIIILFVSINKTF